MPLHRDIHWLGRQWAVTGHGLQLINQKQMGYYDIEVARLWEPGVIEAMRSKAWINRADFDKAVEVARIRFSQTAPAGAPQVRRAISRPSPAAQPATRAPVEPTAGPAIEELLARLKSRSSALTPSAKPVETPPVAPPRAERLAPESATPSPPEPGPIKPEPPKPEPPKPESPETVPAAPAASKPSPPPVTPVSLSAAPARSGRPKPTWAAFARKVAVNGRLVRPWRVRLTRWHRNLPGLPRRP